MKNKLFILLALFCTLSLHGQEQLKVAIYITGSIEPGTKRVFGTKLAEAFNQNGAFSAADNTADFLAQAKRDQGFSNSATITDDQLGQLGKHFGAQFVCVAELIKAADANLVSAKMILAQNDAVMAVAESVSKLNSVDELGKTASTIVNQLFSMAGIDNANKPTKNKGASALAGLFSTKKQQKGSEEQEPTKAKNPNEDPLKIDMILVKEGDFMMGAPKDSKGSEKDEKPGHKVTLPDFYISKTEVTYAQWKAVMGSYPSKKFEGDEQLPVCVSWIETQEFISKLNAKTGAKYRLPSEAEWEYAARGGNQSKDYKYSGSDNVDEVAWYKDISGDKTHIAGSRQGNELGIHDMSGNVWEWCSDRFEKYSASPQFNPVMTDKGKDRVIRGGSYDSPRGDVRVLRRMQKNPEKRSDDVGFRLASTQKPE
ncbi:hypothetical protein AGMMS49525_09570 [Bacteroidia bacterium]|nr:hypothetical protein AGMMS49525_09570 [Bacteroidia bacterium]